VVKADLAVVLLLQQRHQMGGKHLVPEVGTVDGVVQCQRLVEAGAEDQEDIGEASRMGLPG